MTCSTWRKLEQGSAPLQITERRSRGTGRDAVERTTREMAHDAGIALETEVAPDLPAVPWTQQRIAYVFTNLITNAIKYSPPAARSSSARQPGQTRAGKPCVRFSVKDQGPGIAASTRNTSSSAFIACQARTRPAPAWAFPSPAKSSWPIAAKSASSASPARAASSSSSSHWPLHTSRQAAAPRCGKSANCAGAGSPDFKR